MRTIAFHPEANEEFREAHAWYMDRSEIVADEYLAAVYGLTNRLADHPKLGHLWPRLSATLGVRRALVDRFPFALAYLHDEDTLSVVAVAHNSRKPGYWRGRLGHGKALVAANRTRHRARR